MKWLLIITFAVTALASDEGNDHQNQTITKKKQDTERDMRKRDICKHK